MKIKHAKWTVSDLNTKRGNIELAPTWQRGSAWTPPRRVLLIDSMLRGMDFPKIYLRRQKSDGTHYDVVDGQQRLRAIWDFIDGKYALVHPVKLSPINGTEISGKTFPDLDKKLQQKLLDFSTVIAIIYDAPLSDITLLFARLQLAVQLNPPELRNAILCPLRNEVDATALNHNFFKSSAIQPTRMKHQDYTAHAYALALNGCVADLKAPDLRSLYERREDISLKKLTQLSSEVDDSLEILAKVNAICGNRITQKWIFCDLFYFIIEVTRSGKKINIKKMASIYKDFEKLRSENTRSAIDLLKGNPGQLERDMYKYIEAFRIEGGKSNNLAIRSSVVSRSFKGCIV